MQSPHAIRPAHRRAGGADAAAGDWGPPAAAPRPVNPAVRPADPPWVAVGVGMVLWAVFQAPRQAVGWAATAVLSPAVGDDRCPS